MEYQGIYDTVENVCFRDVIYANGNWILTALGIDPISCTFNGEVYVCITPDLKKFTSIKLADNMYSGTPKIAYGNGVYIIAFNEDIWISSDLVKFTHKNIKSVLNVTFSSSIKFINGLFILATWTRWYRISTGAFLRYEGHILTSKDGTTWSNRTSFDEALNDVTYQNNNYYICGTRGHIACSTNLINWDKCNSNCINDIVSIAGGAFGIVAISSSKETLYSNTGVDYQKVFFDNDRVGNKVVYGNGIYMQMMANNAMAYSKNGINWQFLYKSSSGYSYGMAFSSEKQQFLIAGNWWAKNNNGSIIVVNITRDLAVRIDDEELIYVYDLDFNFIGVVDSFKSLRWNRKYFEAGEFEIVLSTENNNLELFQENRIVVRNNYTESGIIETIKISDNGVDEDLTVTGRFLSSVLDRRIVKQIINFDGTSIDGMKVLLNQMTSFPSFEIEQTTLDSPEISFQCSYKNIYNYLIKLAKYSGVGFRIVPNVENKVFIFENYVGKDRTISQNKNERYSFSDNEHNVNNAELTSSNKTTINYCLVGGQGEGTNRVLVDVNESGASGFDLYEKFVDSKSSSSDGLSTDTYKEVLKQNGVNALYEPIDEFKFDVSATDYRDKFDLGDIVDCAFERWKYQNTSRITEIEEVIEDGKKTVSLTLGTPIPDVWENDD